MDDYMEVLKKHILELVQEIHSTRALVFVLKYLQAHNKVD